MVLGQYRAILGGTRFNFGEFYCCEICLFLLGALLFFLMRRQNCNGKLHINETEP